MASAQTQEHAQPQAQSPVHGERIPQIPALTGVRAVAAALVFFGHVLEPHRAMMPFVIHYGFTGVDVFFALSGYLFTYQYADALLQGTFRWGRYLRRRLIRIYPVTTRVVIVASISRWEYLNWQNIVLHLTLLHGWFTEYRLRLNGPMWSLTIEESYYLIAPLLITMFAVMWQTFTASRGAWNRSWKHGVAWSTGALGVWWVSAMLSRGMSLTYQDVVYTLSGVWDADASTFTIFGRISEFVAGMCGAILMKGAMPRRAWVGDVLVVISIAGYIGISAFIEGHGGEMQVGMHKMGMLALKSYACIATVGLMGLHMGGNSGGYFSRFLSLPFVIVLGECSFALYIIQFIPIGSSLRAGMDMQSMLVESGVAPVLASVISYSVMNLVAVLLYKFFEQPVRRVLRSRFAD